MFWQSKRIIFAGGTNWSTDFLKLLVDEGFSVVGVLIPPDTKKDRGQKTTVHMLKTEAAKLNIAVFQPKKLNDSDFLSKFKQLEPDLVVVVAYGKIFSKVVLNIPSFGFINFHPSLLPKLRGPSPIVSTILENFTETGVSIIKLGEGMDDGPILAQENVKIDPRETSKNLTKKLVELGKKILPNVLKKYLNAIEMPVSRRMSLYKIQNNTQATYCKIIKKSDGGIDWSKETAEQIDRKIRALNPQFKTYTFLKKTQNSYVCHPRESGDPCKSVKRINILESAGIQDGELSPGQYKLLNNYLAVGTKQNILLVSELQVEGKKPITAKEFMQGYGGKGSFLSSREHN